MKWDMFSVKSMDEYIQSKTHLPEMIILESEKYAQGEDLDCLERFQKRGAIIVFGCLEDPKNIEKNQELQDFLGIYKIVSKKTELTGAKLFEGLLLGGEVIYETPEDKDERDRQDLQLNVPWYQVGSGTKTYMVGLLDQSKQKETVENEELPTLIWRNGIRNGSIFCVVGDYMKDSTALGLLDGMVAEASSYYIYPVVNAQNLSMINFPVFADENNEQMMELYSQSITGMDRDIMWPSLISIVEKGGLKMSCFMQPQTNYEDGIEPTSKDLVFYLKQMKEQNAEDKFYDVLEEVPRVRKDLGEPPLVTPSSQIVGTQAVFNVLMGERYKMVTKETKAVLSGEYGKTVKPFNKEVQKKCIGDKEPITCRPADLIPDELDTLRGEMAQWSEQDEDVLSYALFPQVATDFFKYREAQQTKVDATVAKDGAYPV